VVARRVLWLIALGAVAYVGAACSLQRSLLYPSPGAPARSPAEAHDDLRVGWVGAARTEVWYLPPHSRPEKSTTLVFTHGNGELIDDWLDAFEVPRTWGVGVLLVEYPGYGRSGGQPTEASIAQTSIDAYDFLLDQPEVDPSRVVAYGRSLGGGAACALSRQRPVAALILESTFTSVRDLARRFGLFGPLVLDPFENLDAVKAYEGPVLVIHGERDEVIPVAHGRALAAASPNAELHVGGFGHNDAPRLWVTIRRFLESNGLL